MFLVCTVCFYGALHAQAVPQTTAPDASKLILKEGVDVKLRFAEDISSKTVASDDPVTLILDEDLEVGDVVVARSGAKAFGTVSNAKKVGMMGKGGEPERCSLYRTL